jgi:hypothetical protein
MMSDDIQNPIMVIIYPMFIRHRPTGQLSPKKKKLMHLDANNADASKTGGSNAVFVYSSVHELLR